MTVSFEVAVEGLCKEASDQGPEGDDDGFVLLMAVRTVVREVEISRIFWKSKRRYFIVD